MKNTIKFLGIIVLVTVIGFSFVACGGGDGGGGGGVKLTMKFEENYGWDQPGNENWTRWIYNYNENTPFDLADMLRSNKVYVFTYSFKSNVDIDSFCIYFYNMDDVDYNWQMISSWTGIKNDIKKNTTYSGRVAIIPSDDAVGLLPKFTSLRFDIMNRDVTTPAVLSFYQFSLEQVTKETPGISEWTVSDKTFQISDTEWTFAEIKTSFEGKSNVLHIKPTYNANAYNRDYLIDYDLSDYAGETIEIVMSMDVYLKKEARIAWQIDSSDPYYPVVCGTVAPDDHFPYHSGPALPANTWYTISGSNIITVSDSDDAGKTLYLSGPQIDGAEAYFANATFTINEGSGDSDTPVTLNSVTPNGSSSQSTTQLTLTFSAAITGLSADNIILSGNVSGITKGTLTGSGPTYTLPISGFTAGGNLIVWVSKLGYTITNPSKTVIIFGTGGSSGGSGSGGSGSGGGGGSNGNVIMNGTWSRTSGDYTYTILISGSNNWTFSDNISPIFKGTWTSSVPPAAPSSGNLTLTATHQNSSSGWISLPPEYASVATNTATFSINSAGNQLTITNSASASAEVWGKTEGTYMKQ